MDLKQLIEQLMEDNRELLRSLDQEARLCSKLLTEKVASQLDLAYRTELQSLESALERAETRVGELELRLAEIEKRQEKKTDPG